MFEGKIVSARADSATDDGALHAPAWAEIVARLAAGHDFRRAIARSPHPAGNFDRFGTLHHGEAVYGQRLVNPDGLARGKGPGGMVLATADCAATGDRETR